MAGFDIYFDALEDCAGKANSVANQFKGVADESPAAPGPACFGSLPDASGKLVEAVKKLETRLDSETRHAQRNLKKVEAALYKVIGNVRKADNPDPEVAQA
ncbi:hypothetical protein [Nonomuraea sediminis]|uniref:hypothetical protein n=1 Tax=Nonomuraea sediminis TaxID=2835864 RepID=UPI001BDD128F|nr:hypothetical protein [Nonomuraea sediminis]